MQIRPFPFPERNSDLGGETAINLVVTGTGGGKLLRQRLADLQFQSRINIHLPGRSGSVCHQNAWHEPAGI